MSSAILPLLRPSRFGIWSLAATGWVSLRFVLQFQNPGKVYYSWLLVGFCAGALLGHVVGEVQSSQRAAIVPDLARRMRGEVFLLLAVLVSGVGMLSWITKGPVDSGLALTALGLAIGLRPSGVRCSPTLKIVFVLALVGLVPTFIFERSAFGWINAYWGLFILVVLSLLVHCALQLLSDGAVRDRPALEPTPPPGLRPFHFERRNLPARSWLGRPLLLRLDGTGTTLRQWVRAAHFESPFGAVDASVGLGTWLVGLALVGVSMLVLAAIVTAFEFLMGGSANGVEWMGVTEHLQRLVLSDMQGIFMALMWGLTLLLSSGLCHDFPYPLSRRRRSHVSFLASLGDHASIVTTSLAFVGFVVFLNVPAAIDLLSGAMPGMARGLLVVSLLAPVLQRRGALGRDWLLGDPIERPIKVLLFLGLYLTFAFVWRGIFAGADVSTELSTYGVLLVLSQLMYYFELRRYFSRADLVPTFA